MHFAVLITHGLKRPVVKFGLPAEKPNLSEASHPLASHRASDKTHLLEGCEFAQCLHEDDEISWSQRPSETECFLQPTEDPRRPSDLIRVTGGYERNHLRSWHLIHSQSTTETYTLCEAPQVAG